MTNKELIRQYVSTTGLPIPEYQFNKLNNNLKTSYLRKRIQAAQNSSNHYLKDYEIFALPDDTRNNYISNIDSDGIENLLKYSKEPDKIYNILGNKGIQYISNLDSHGIFYLLKYSKEPEKIYNILGDKGIQFISNLNSNDIKYLLSSKEPDKIINILGDKGIEVISNFNSNDIALLLSSSKERKKIKAILTKYGKI